MDWERGHGTGGFGKQLGSEHEMETSGHIATKQAESFDFDEVLWLARRLTHVRVRRHHGKGEGGGGSKAALTDGLVLTGLRRGPGVRVEPTPEK
jgi:hypothetical protein